MAERGKSDTKHEAGQSGKRISPILMQKSLKGVNYPASKDALAQRAQENQAAPEVLAELEKLPAERFNSPKDVMKALGGVL